MDIKKNITIELSENDVKEIIEYYLNSDGYNVTVDNINFSVGVKTEGFGMGEYDVYYFKAAYVNCKEK